MKLKNYAMALFLVIAQPLLIASPTITNKHTEKNKNFDSKNQSIFYDEDNMVMFNYLNSDNLYQEYSYGVYMEENLLDLDSSSPGNILSGDYEFKNGWDNKEYVDNQDSSSAKAAFPTLHYELKIGVTNGLKTSLKDVDDNWYVDPEYKIYDPENYYGVGFELAITASNDDQLFLVEDNGDIQQSSISSYEILIESVNNYDDKITDVYSIWRSGKSW